MRLHEVVVGVGGRGRRRSRARARGRGRGRGGGPGRDRGQGAGVHKCTHAHACMHMHIHMHMHVHMHMHMHMRMHMRMHLQGRSRPAGPHALCGSDASCAIAWPTTATCQSRLRRGPRRLGQGPGGRGQQSRLYRRTHRCNGSGRRASPPHETKGPRAGLGATWCRGACTHTWASMCTYTCTWQDASGGQDASGR